MGETLTSILDTEITPELVPAKQGEKPQSTQAKIGPYSLQDFTLFHVMRRGYRPPRSPSSRGTRGATARRGSGPRATPRRSGRHTTSRRSAHWLEVFVRRYFANQFKRSALPNGPKVVAGGSLSPRGDWRMPSDAAGAAWLDELDANVPEA